MTLLDPKFLAAKQELIGSLRSLRDAVVPLRSAAREGVLADPGGRLAETAELVDGELAKLGSNRFRIGIFGLVKAGKSTLINALAEEYVTEVDSLPATTAALHLVRRGGPPMVFFLPASGKPARESSRDEVLRLLDEKGNPDNREQVDYVDFPVELKYLEEDVVLVDTPGLGYILKTISDRAGRELHESVHAVVLVVRVFGGQLWQREIREFLAEAVQRVPRAFVVVNCDETKPDEWGEEAFRRIGDRFTNELRESGRVLRAALQDGHVSLHFLSALQGASALLRLRNNTGDPAEAQRDLEQSRFLEFRRSLSEFAAGDKRLWDDLRFRARGLSGRIEALRESVRAQVIVHLDAEKARVKAEQDRIAGQFERLKSAVAEVKESVAMEAEDLIAELIEKARGKADEFLDEQVQPAVLRWLGTADTPAQLNAELARLLEGWKPQLQEFMDKRRQAFGKRLALKIRNDLFSRLNVAVEVDTEVPLKLAEVAALPTYDIAADLEKGISRWITYAVAAGAGVGLWQAFGPEAGPGLGAAAGGAIAVLLVGRLLVADLVAAPFRSFLRTASVPAIMKGPFSEAAIRRLAGTKEEMRKAIRENFTRRRDDIVAALNAGIAAALDRQAGKLADEWTAARGQLAARQRRLDEVTAQVGVFLSSADAAVSAAAEAAG
jgi:GTPase SAR1 family protein